MIRIKAENSHVEMNVAVSDAKLLTESMLIIDGLVSLWQKKFEVSHKEADIMLMAAYEMLKDDIERTSEFAVDSDFSDLIEKFRKDKKDE